MNDLISRADAIEAIEIVDWYHQNSNKDMVHGANDDEHQAWYKAEDVYKALEAIPSADRPKDGDLISRADAIEALQTDIVRCDDCKYKGKVGGLLVCRIHEVSTRTDDYCSRGERSEE